MTTFEFQTAMQENEMRLNSFAQQLEKENGVIPYSITEQSNNFLRFNCLQNITTYKMTSQRALFSDNAQLSYNE